jgi:hypothetical protein
MVKGLEPLVRKRRHANFHLRKVEYAHFTKDQGKELGHPFTDPRAFKNQFKVIGVQPFSL